MKTLTSLFFLLSVMLLSPATVKAQEEDMPPPQERMEEIKAMKSAYITRKMGFSTQEAQSFWPLYNQYDEALEKVRAEQRQAHRSMRERTGRPTEAEAKRFIEQEMDRRTRELNIRKDYTNKFIERIGAVRTMDLFKAEKDFHRELLRRFKDERDGRKGPEGRP